MHLNYENRGFQKSKFLKKNVRPPPNKTLIFRKAPLYIVVLFSDKLFHFCKPNETYFFLLILVA